MIEELLPYYEKQLQELRSKYLKARNPEIQRQLNFFIIDLQEELKMRWYEEQKQIAKDSGKDLDNLINICLLYTSPSPRDS